MYKNMLQYKLTVINYHHMHFYKFRDICFVQARKSNLFKQKQTEARMNLGFSKIFKTFVNRCLVGSVVLREYHEVMLFM